ncbi:MAG: hypothetical protein JXQ23_09370 [Clostridia bacterium]|nr:hypothetical protein [Clostridia bacterium]
MDLFLKILGIAMAVIGVAVVYGAKLILKKTDLASKQTIKMEGLETEKLKELQEYKAIAMIKIIGSLIFLPGMVLILIAFR